ncbi:AfsR/SARP family transcriptional regulator [Symbioplanes lichenis]|uniref:AfsR/SARP family transcriptional regulator n=1 Tax=Symbioplanes lichenis TaxID=1629072 RepID=UPI002738476F|nr:BTAD domain-containing putative transcriptional regulator [Actinoplanes lichenis]
MEDLLPGPKIYFSLFGGVRAWRTQQPLDLGPPQRRALLGLLLAADGRGVGAGDLIDAMWGDRPGASAMNSLHRHVGELRRTFEPELPARAPGRWLVRSGTGYRILVDAVSCDLRRFRLLNQQAAGADPATATDLRLQALALAPGPPGLGLPLRETAVFQLIERERVETALAAAAPAVRPGEVVPHLLLLADRHPLDEPLHAALIDCLSATGRRAEALEVYAGIARRLRDELGITPDRLLGDARRRVVERTAPAPVRAPAPATPRDLPPAPPLPAGRERELAAADATLSRPATAGHRICAVTGLAGIGKTAFALQWAHRVAGQFPDGQLYVSLAGAEPADVLRGFLRALGAPMPAGGGEAELAAAFHRTVRGRKLLFVLDDARGSREVRALLPAEPECLVVAISRFCLTGLIAHEGAQPVPLEAPVRPVPAGP